MDGLPVIGLIHEALRHSNPCQWSWAVFTILLGAFIIGACSYQNPSKKVRRILQDQAYLVAGMALAAAIGTLTFPGFPPPNQEVMGGVTGVLIVIGSIMLIAAIKTLLTDLVRILRQQPYRRWTRSAAGIYAVMFSFTLLVVSDFTARFHKDDASFNMWVHRERITTWITTWAIVLAGVLVVIEGIAAFRSRRRRAV